MKRSHLTVEMSRHLAGPGGARAYCGEVGGLDRADILIEHCTLGELELEDILILNNAHWES